MIMSEDNDIESQKEATPTKNDDVDQSATDGSTTDGSENQNVGTSPKNDGVDQSTIDGSTRSTRSTQRATEIKAQRRTPLKHGRVRTDHFTFRYVFVQKGWLQRAESNFIEEVMAGLGLSLPSYVFRVIENKESEDESWSVLPENVGLDEKRTLIYDDGDKKKLTQKEKKRFQQAMKVGTKRFLDTLSETIGQFGDSYYLMGNPHFYDDFGKQLLGSLNGGVDGTAIVECNLWSDDQVEELWKEKNTTTGMEEIIELLKDSAVSVGEDIENEVTWQPKFATSDRKFKHVVVFEDKEEHHEFRRSLYRDVSVGLLVYGGVYENEGIKHIVESAMKFLREGQPTFIFEHTCGVAHCLVSLLKHIADNGNDGASDEKSDSNTLENRLFRDVGAQIDQEKEGDFLLGFLENFKNMPPLRFNKNTVVTIDPIKDRPQQMIREITKVMSSIYDYAPESGEDPNAPEHSFYEEATAQLDDLKFLESRELRVGWFLKYLIIFFGLMTTGLSCGKVYLETQNAGAQPATQNAGDSNSLLVTGIGYATVAFPILLAITLTIFQNFSPTVRLSKIRLARAQTERLLKLYECRVDKFRVRASEGPVHRRNLKVELDKILDTVLKSHELTKYSMITRTIEKDNGRKSKTGEQKVKTGGESKGEKMSKNKFFLSSEEYIERRVQVYRKKLEDKMKFENWLLRVLQILAIVLSALTAILSSLTYQVWNPLVLAFVAAIESVVEFRCMEKRIETANVTYIQLQKTLSWWRSLSTVGQTLPRNKTRLVTECENTILERERTIAGTILAHDQVESGKNDAPDGEGKKQV